MSRVTLYYGVVGLKGSIGDLCHLQLLVVSLLGKDDWGLGDEEVVDPGVGDQVGLELVQLHGEGISKYHIILDQHPARGSLRFPP